MKRSEGVLDDWRAMIASLVSERGVALERYGYLLCGDWAGAADLVQEALVRVFSRSRRGWAPGDAEPYIRRAMLNYHVDRTRRTRRWALLVPRLAADTSMADPASGVAVRLDVMAALARLSSRQRACVVLRYYEDYSVAQIADALGCGEGTVKRHLSDAVGRLAESMGTAEQEGSGHAIGS